MTTHSVIYASADQDRIAAAAKAFAALTEIKRLHTPVTACPGCHLRECPGDCDCDWNSYDHPVALVCGICCWSQVDNARDPGCIDSHDHAPGRPACSTVEIIERAGL